MHPRLVPLALLAALIASACRSGPAAADPPAGSAGEAQLLPGFDGPGRPIDTASEQAQRWFDQGLKLVYAFNHDEAVRSFERAAASDPGCAMAWWGVAYAHGLHINKPEMEEAASRAAYAASRKALAAIEADEQPWAVERALVEALARRYALPVPADRAHLDRAYATAMQGAWREFPDDADVGALFAEALMDLQPWDLWTPEPEPAQGAAEAPEAQPKGRTLEILAALERVLELDPNHVGANHFYVHALEASSHPERALESADRLTELVPGAGHLVHMPAHIYARVGRWGDAADSNERAIEADRAYFARAPEPDFYSLYYVHNLHFLAWAAMMEGRFETALAAARAIEREVPPSFVRGHLEIADGLMPVNFHVLVRFGRWREVLAEPEPEAERIASRLVRHYARGVAHAALGETGGARDELAHFDALRSKLPEGWFAGVNELEDVLAIARAMLTGEILFREGKLEECFATLRQAVALEDALSYDEPRGWMQPVRHALGALLVEAGRYAEAERVYREDLRRNPGNGWAWIGLARALAGLGQEDAARSARAELAQVWTRSDIEASSSCYCAATGVAAASAR